MMGLPLAARHGRGRPVVVLSGDCDLGGNEDASAGPSIPAPGAGRVAAKPPAESAKQQDRRQPADATGGV